MVTHYVKKITITCSQIFRHIFETMIVVTSDKKGSIILSKNKFWKVMETSASRLKTK